MKTAVADWLCQTIQFLTFEMAALRILTLGIRCFRQLYVCSIYGDYIRVCGQGMHFIYYEHCSCIWMWCFGFIYKISAWKLTFF